VNDETPIAIGGLGGSGTRVVADLVGALGFDLGSDLNTSQDNLAFTLLFKQPACFRVDDGLVDPTDRLVRDRVELFVAAMTHRGLTPQRLVCLGRAVLDVAMRKPATDVAVTGDRHSRRLRTSWGLQRARRMVGDLRGGEPGPWGWKEPNTFVFLPALIDHLPALRYIHVVRNGLDMAFSRNDGQVRNWGRSFGIVDPDDDPALAQLRYWARANTVVDRQLAKMRSSLVLRYEDVTGDGGRALQSVCDFLGVESTPQARSFVAGLRPSSSSGRHRQHDHGQLLERGGSEVARALARFGY